MVWYGPEVCPNIQNLRNIFLLRLFYCGRRSSLPKWRRNRRRSSRFYGAIEALLYEPFWKTKVNRTQGLRPGCFSIRQINSKQNIIMISVQYQIRKQFKEWALTKWQREENVKQKKCRVRSSTLLVCLTFLNGLKCSHLKSL